MNIVNLKGRHVTKTYFYFNERYCFLLKEHLGYKCFDMSNELVLLQTCLIVLYHFNTQPT